MGFFSAFKGTLAYEKMLKAHGVNPYSIPSDVNGRICSYANQHFEFLAQLSPALGGSTGRETVLRHAARIVAFCVLGPSSFRKAGGDCSSMNDTMRNAATHWRNDGPESEFETIIIKTLSDADLLQSEFVTAFDSML